MRRSLVALCVLVFTSLTQAQTTAPATQPAEVTVKVITARVNRNTPELQKKFRNRYGSDGNPGVTIQLLMTLQGQQMLPLTQQAISVDTFVDDTFQNLLGEQRGYYGSSAVQLSDDGTTVLFPVNASKPPADDAQRVFVRGSITARVGKGEQKVVTGKVKLKINENFTAGPYKGQIRSLNDNGSNNMSVGVNLTGGEGTSVRNVRVTTAGGAVLQERSEPRFDYPERSPISINLNIPSGNDEIVLDLSYFEKLDTVKIPFEAQVDIGHAKAGPIEPGQPNKAPGADRRRAWPPPANEQIELPARRASFAPPTQPTVVPEGPTVIKPTVDLFSLTLGKPPTDVVAAAHWAAQPSSQFVPRGFTVARLLLSIPDGVILAIPAGDMALSSFGDDKTPKVAAGISDSFINNYSRRNIAMVSREGQQALINFPIDAAVTPGATKATIAGSVKASVGRAEKTVTLDPVELKAGTKLTAGPFEVTVRDVYQAPPMTPEAGPETQITATLHIKGPIRQIRSVQLGTISPMPIQGSAAYPYYNEQPEPIETTVQIMLPRTPTEKQPITVRYFDKVETVTLPFELSTTLGL
jgi:hypothetical protein